MPAHRTRPVVVSESKQLRALITILREMPVMGSSSRDEMEYVIDKLEQLANNAVAGLHANPGALVVYGNPGGKVRVGDDITVSLGPALGYVEEIKYDRTRAPSGYYFHDFGPGDAIMVAHMQSQKILLIANVNGRPLWGEQ